MDMRVELNAIRNNKCCVCGHVLSVFPIYCCAWVSTKTYICGRCRSVPVVSTWRRQFLYEEITQNVTFPCSYDRCKKTLRRTVVEDHERYCRYKITRCPTCLSTIKTVELGMHYTNEHEELIKTFEEICVKKNERNKMYVTQFLDKCFFVYILDYKVAVFATERTKYTKFDLEVSPESNDFAISFKNLPVIHYEESVHCFACITKRCELECHPLSIEYQSENERNDDLTSFMTSVGGSWLKGILTNEESCSRYRITLIADETVSVTEEEGEEDEEEINNLPVVSAVRKVLSCPYCIIYMAAPIFMCATGHSICNVCMPKMERCPLCQAYFSESRNYPLEELAEQVAVPCQHDSKGCPLMGTSSRMLAHEVDCSFRTQ